MLTNTIVLIKRKVQDKGVISFKNREIKFGNAFASEYVALGNSQENNIYEYIFVINCKEL